MPDRSRHVGHPPEPCDAKAAFIRDLILCDGRDTVQLLIVGRAELGGGRASCFEASANQEGLQRDRGGLAHEHRAASLIGAELQLGSSGLAWREVLVDRGVHQISTEQPRIPFTA